MCTTGLRLVVEQVVNDRVYSGNMFTAHDITLEIRNRGHWAPHNQVRDAVHGYFRSGGMGDVYTRSMISVPNGATPFLYYRADDDPFDDDDDEAIPVTMMKTLLSMFLPRTGQLGRRVSLRRG